MDRWKEVFFGVLMCCAALGWWGEAYPQFTLVKGTYEIVCEDGSTPDEALEAAADGSRLYWEILEADSSRIRLRSRFLRNINTLQEQRRKNYESGDQ